VTHFFGGPRVFIQYIQTGPPYQMGSLVPHPRASPSRGHRFLRLWHMDRFYINRGISSLVGNDSVGILAAANTANNGEYIVIIRCYATALLNKERRGFLCGPCRNSRLLLLGNGAVNTPYQQYIWRGVFYAVRAESIKEAVEAVQRDSSVSRKTSFKEGQYCLSEECYNCLCGIVTAILKLW
jgi:hypothetical protein